MRWWPGLRPGFCWASSRRSPGPLVGWGGGHPLPRPHPLGAFDASILAPVALVFQPEPYHFLKRSVEEDRATAIGNMHKTVLKMARVDNLADGQTDTQTHRRTYHNTSQPLSRAKGLLSFAAILHINACIFAFL